MPRRFPALLVACLGVLGMSAAAAQATVLKVEGTSDISDSGLFSNVIGPGFAAFSPGNSASYTAVASGTAINDAENPSNHIDVIMVHSPSLEAPFVAGGYSYEPLGRAIFYNDYVIVGPTSDPAGVATADPNNAVGAYQAIAAEGAAHSDVTFISRNDNSGTNVKEQQIWNQTTGVTLQAACNAGGASGRKEPGTACTPAGHPSWYKYNTTSTPPNQGVNLIDTNNCDATAYPDGGCYTMTDRGTFDNLNNQGLIPNLEIVSQNNSSGAPGGAGELTNPFHAYLVASSSNKTVATAFMNYVTSTAFHNALSATSPQDFFQDAYGVITSSSIPTHASAGSSITVSATFKYPPPVAQVIAGMPVQLQSAPASGGPWTNVGSTVNTDATGTATFTPTIGSSTTWYRVDMGTYDDTTLASQFSPNDNNQLGANNGKVTVP
jgi:tungstate transport system substrate-binding protein